MSMEFLFTILVLILFAKVFGEILHHYGFSSLIGEVAVGIILGPAVLGWISITPISTSGPPTPVDPTSGAIHGVAMLGLVVLMLNAGMNSRIDLFMKVKFKAFLIAVGGMAVSFALGFVVPYMWGFGLMPSLFVAAALSNTATEIVTRVTEGRPHSQLLIGAALIDDIIAVYILGILSTAAIKGPLDLSALLWATLGIIAFFLIIIYLSRELVIKRNVIKLLWRFEHRGVPLAFAVGLALALAVIAQNIGLHAIIGAYMAGVFIGRLRERPKVTLQSRVRLNTMLDDVSISLQSILTPMFFVYVGLTFAPNWGQVNFIMLPMLILAAFLGKFLGCGGAAAATGYGRRDSVEIGTAMVPRGSIELAVLQFALLSIPGFTPELYAAMVITTLTTTLLAPILFKFVSKA